MLMSPEDYNSVKRNPAPHAVVAIVVSHAAHCYRVVMLV